MTLKSAITPSFSGPDGRDIAGRAAKHVLGSHAHRLEDLAAPSHLLADGDDRGLVENDATTTDIDQGIRGTQIDR